MLTQDDHTTQRWFPAAWILLVSSIYFVSPLSAEEAAVARVHGQTIIRQDLEPPPQVLEASRAKMDSEKFAQWLHNFRGQRLMGNIFGALMSQYADQNRIRPTSGEIDSIKKAIFNPAQEKSREMEKKQREEERKKIQSGEWTDAMVQSVLDSLNQQAPGSMQGLTIAAIRKNPDLYFKAVDQLLADRNHQMAGQWVMRWKINAALFKHYGGRVIHQQLGPEPVDAYRKFLQEQEKKGAFAIEDPAYAEAFWNYFTNDKLHVFMSPDEAQRAMSKPWWEK